MHLSPDDEQAIRREFDALMNLAPAELTAWLQGPKSRLVGVVRRGETESIGRRAGAKVLAIHAKPVSELTDADYVHMRKVIGFCRRHLAQRPKALRYGGDVRETRWRWSLMNWGHDPLRVGSGGEPSSKM